jgi:hypothetical protein
MGISERRHARIFDRARHRQWRLAHATTDMSAQFARNRRLALVFGPVGKQLVKIEGL